MAGHREPTVYVEAPKAPTEPEKRAAVIDIHGLADDAMTFQSIVERYIKPYRLKHVRWVIPNAAENRDAMAKAWYLQIRLNAVPPSRPEMEDDEDEDGMKASRAFIEGLIDELVADGIPPHRIVLGGFSQGCVMALFVHLTSRKYAGKLGGIYGIGGYLGMPDRYPQFREESGLPPAVEDNVPVFICRGDKDYAVPRRYFTQGNDKLRELGVKETNLRLKEYEGVGHSLATSVLKGLCEFLEKVIPPIP